MFYLLALLFQNRRRSLLCLQSILKGKVRILKPRSSARQRKSADSVTKTQQQNNKHECLFLSLARECELR